MVLCASGLSKVFAFTLKLGVERPRPGQSPSCWLPLEPRTVPAPESRRSWRMAEDSHWGVGGSSAGVMSEPGELSEGVATLTDC